MDLEATGRRQLQSTDDGFACNTSIGEVFISSPQKAPASNPRFDSCSETRPSTTSFAQATIEALDSVSDQVNVRFPSPFLKGFMITVG
jgi:hypothetical protein